MKIVPHNIVVSLRPEEAQAIVDGLNSSTDDALMDDSAALAELQATLSEALRKRWQS